MAAAPVVELPKEGKEVPKPSSDAWALEYDAKTDTIEWVKTGKTMAEEESVLMPSPDHNAVIVRTTKNVNEKSLPLMIVRHSFSTAYKDAHLKHPEPAYTLLLAATQIANIFRVGGTDIWAIKIRGRQGTPELAGDEDLVQILEEIKPDQEWIGMEECAKIKAESAAKAKAKNST